MFFIISRAFCSLLSAGASCFLLSAGASCSSLSAGSSCSWLSAEAPCAWGSGRAIKGMSAISKNKRKIRIYLKMVIVAVLNNLKYSCIN